MRPAACTDKQTTAIIVINFIIQKKRTCAVARKVVLFRSPSLQGWGAARDGASWYHSKLMFAARVKF